MLLKNQSDVSGVTLSRRKYLCAEARVHMNEFEVMGAPRGTLWYEVQGTPHAHFLDFFITIFGFSLLGIALFLPLLRNVKRKND